MLQSVVVCCKELQGIAVGCCWWQCVAECCTLHRLIDEGIVNEGIVNCRYASHAAHMKKSCHVCKYVMVMETMP